MKRSVLSLALALAVLLGATLAPAAASATDPASKPRSSAGYDPARDPAKDLAAAKLRAKAEGKRILLEVGGEWCIWCHILEEFIASRPALKKALDDGFVLVKVNFSEEQKNERFLGGYPKVPGYPHIFVLATDGSLLHSQETSELEAGKSYDETKLGAFFARWAGPK